MSYFQNAIYYLDQLGLSDVILPFILVFTIIFAVLQKAKLFGTERENKRYNLIVALAIGLLVVIPHITGRYTMGVDVVDIINNAIPSVSVIAIAVIMFLVLVGIFFEPRAGGWVSSLVLILSLFAVIWIFGKAAGWWYNMPFWLDDPDVQALVVIILVFGIIVWFITTEPGQKKGLLDWMKDLSDKAFGGGGK